MLTSSHLVLTSLSSNYTARLEMRHQYLAPCRTSYVIYHIIIPAMLYIILLYQLCYISYYYTSYVIYHIIIPAMLYIILLYQLCYISYYYTSYVTYHYL